MYSQRHQDYDISSHLHAHANHINHSHVRSSSRRHSHSINVVDKSLAANQAAIQLNKYASAQIPIMPPYITEAAQQPEPSLEKKTFGYIQPSLKDFFSQFPSITPRLRLSPSSHTNSPPPSLLI